MSAHIRIKKLISIFYLIFILPLLTGCWDYREVDNISIVIGFAVDKGTEEKYLVTYEIVDFSQMHTEGKVNSELIESEGDTMLMAARNALSKNYPKLYFGHTVSVIINKEIAQEGILEIVDFLCRDAETRLSIHLFVSKEETAGEILKVKPLGSELLSMEINNIISEQRYLSKIISHHTFEFINCVRGEGISCSVPALVIEKNGEDEVVQISGAAVFKEDKVLGFIDGEETRALNFILNKVKGGVIVEKLGPDSEDGIFSLEILKNNTKVKSNFKDNKPRIEIEVKTTVALDEHVSKKDYESEEGLEELGRIGEEQLKEEMEGIIKKIQTQFGSDIFGFGECIYMHHPKKWKVLKDNWDEEFKKLEVSIKAEIKIINTGLLDKSIEKGE